MLSTKNAPQILVNSNVIHNKKAAQFACAAFYLLNIKENIMKKILWLVLFGSLLTACDAKDDCLDNGGHYNDATKICEK